MRPRDTQLGDEPCRGDTRAELDHAPVAGLLPFGASGHHGLREVAEVGIRLVNSRAILVMDLLMAIKVLSPCSQSEIPTLAQALDVGFQPGIREHAESCIRLFSGSQPPPDKLHHMPQERFRLATYGDNTVVHDRDMLISTEIAKLCHHVIGHVEHITRDFNNSGTQVFLREYRWWSTPRRVNRIGECDGWPCSYIGGPPRPRSHSPEARGSCL